MSEELELISNALFENAVPEIWSGSFSSLKPLAT